MAVQFNHMTNSYLNTLQLHLPLFGVCYPSPTSVWIFNVVIILISIPILDQCIYPYLRQYTPNMLKRFGISYVLLIVSASIFCVYETIGHHALSQGSSDSSQSCMFDSGSEGGGDMHMHMSAWLTLLPIGLLSFGEIFLKVTGTRMTTHIPLFNCCDFHLHIKTALLFSLLHLSTTISCSINTL